LGSILSKIKNFIFVLLFLTVQIVFADAAPISVHDADNILIPASNISQKPLKDEKKNEKTLQVKTDEISKDSLQKNVVKNSIEVKLNNANEVKISEIKVSNEKIDKKETEKCIEKTNGKDLKYNKEIIEF